MGKRKRSYIRLPERLACALSCLLPAAQRDELRARHAPAKLILALFDWDHVVLHTHDGSDAWHNLTPMLRQAHREKSRRDTAIAAKVKRISRKTDEWVRRLGMVGAWKPSPEHPKRKIAVRANPWPAKGARKMGRRQ